jgi:hypothetical protein
MDDYKEKVDDYKDQLMSKAASVDQKGKFFTFSKPLTDMIDNGTLFTKFTGLLYQVIGAIFLLIPLYVLYKGIDGNIFDAPFKYVLLAFVFFAAFSLSCWISFQIFFNRKDQFNDLDTSKGYIATAIASNFTSTMGEVIAVFWAIIGTLFSILAIIFDDAESFLGVLGMEGTGAAIADIVFFPVSAFCILIFSRFVSELINAMAEVARNTKR